MASRPKPKGGPRLSIIPARAVTDPDISAQALRVLALLGRHTDDLGWCRRSQVTMAGELHCGRSTIQRGLDQLEAGGYVEKQLEGRGKIEANPDKQPFASYSYRVVLDPPGGPPEAVDSSAGCPPAGTGGAHSRRAPGAHSGGHRVPICRAPLTERLLVNDPLITKSAVPPRAPERRGDPALWTAIAANAPPGLIVKLESWGAVPMRDGDRVVVDFEKGWAERYVRPLHGDMQQAIGVATVFRYAGREGQ